MSLAGRILYEPHHPQSVPSVRGNCSKNFRWDASTRLRLIRSARVSRRLRVLASRAIGLDSHYKTLVTIKYYKASDEWCTASITSLFLRRFRSCFTDKSFSGLSDRTCRSRSWKSTAASETTVDLAFSSCFLTRCSLPATRLPYICPKEHRSK